MILCTHKCNIPALSNFQCAEYTHIPLKKKILSLKNNANRCPKFANICLALTLDLFNAMT